MAQRAFVFSSDVKSLGILTQIFEELTVACEPSHELAHTMKKLSAEPFDAILVDCDDLQTATLIFESLRGSTANHNSMTVAMVDGKAGVPTAFRLGAKTVLSKPLSLEQARGTLRNAFAVQRREAHDNRTFAAATSASATTPSVATPSIPTPSVPQASATTANKPEPAENSTAFKTFATPKAPDVAPPVAPASAISVSAHAAAAAPARAVSNAVTMQPLVKPPAEKPNVPAERGVTLEPAKASAPVKSMENPTANRPAAVRHDAAPTFAILQVEQRKSNRGLIIGVAMVALVGGGIATWTTQPGVRNSVLSQYGKLVHRTPSAPATPPVPAAVDAAQSPAGATKDAEPATQAVAAPAPALEPVQLAQGFQDSPPEASATSTMPTPDNAEPIVVPEEVASAHVLRRVAAWYPTKARHARIKGSVVLTTSVAADGTVQSVDVVRGHPQLVLAAQEAVKQWQFQPYYQDGQPAAFQTQVTVTFPAPKPLKSKSSN